MNIKIQAAQRDAKPIDCPKISTGHFIASQRVDPAPPTRTEARVLSTRKPLQTTSSTPSSGGSLHNKQEPWTSNLQKGNPKHSNLNKVKRQRNIHQVKEHYENPLYQTEEEEIGSLPEKEFRIMIINMIQNLKNKMELQVNRLQTRIEKMQEIFTRPRSNIEESINIEQYSSWD